MCKVKICGITNLEDALASCEYGADAIGFVFHKKSPRLVEPEKVKVAGLHAVQLHGNESPEFCKGIHCKVIKAFRIRGARAMGIGTGEQGIDKEMERYNVSAYLFDTFKEDVAGGTGVTFNWGVVKDLRRVGRIILSGGLNTENVKQAIKIAMH